jgi:glycolate oxidase FAD binding subunit
MGSPHEATGAAHLPADLAARSGVDLVARQGGAVTAIRVEGVAPSVEARMLALRDQFAATAPALEELHTMRSRAFWAEVRDVRLLSSAASPAAEAGSARAPTPGSPKDRRGGAPGVRLPGAAALAGPTVSAGTGPGGVPLLWKISCPPAAGADVAAAIRACRPDARVQYDWSGGLVWVALAAGDPATDDAGHEAVRAALAKGGGHATLVRAPDAVRARIPVFQPRPPALAALSRRVKESFDPKGVFGRGGLN